MSTTVEDSDIDESERATSEPPAEGSVGDLLRPVRTTLGIGVGLAVLSALLEFVPYIAIVEIGRELLDDDSDSVWGWAIVAVVSALLSFLLSWTAVAVCHRADAHFRFTTRRDVARHIGVVPIGWFLTGGSGRVEKAVSDDVKAVHTYVAHVIPDLTTTALAPLVGVTYLFVVDWRFALLLLGYILLVAGAGMSLTQRAMTTFGPEVEEAQQTIAASTVELVDGIAVVKAFGTGRAFDRFVDAVNSLVNANIRWMRALGRPMNFMMSALAPGTLVIVISAMGLVLLEREWIDVGDLVAFLAVGVGLPVSFTKLSRISYPIAAAQDATVRILGLLDQQPLPVSTEPTTPRDASVEFEAVTFGYEPEQPVVRDVSLRLEPGTVTALVGPSGSGKSTLASLVARFFDTDEGRVLLGGVDVRDIDPGVLLSQLSIVFQDVVLIRGTIADNIRLAVPDASDADVESAARAASIHDEIASLPNGYETVIGGIDGANLSHGQRQRITIARAILSDAPIVLLDEATAHADPDSEAHVGRALSELLADRTVLVVAHRLHTIVGADQIAVLDGGRLVASGTHSELIDAGGLYADLWGADRGLA
ncbi:MAG: ABC transporter ATP-binding protein [Actinomycetota bacterium]